MTWILHEGDDIARFAASGGGKAKQLARLKRLGVEVPAFFCVTADAFGAFVRENHLEAVTTSAVDLGERARAIEEAFVRAPLPASVEDALAVALAELAPGGAFVAVRSSGLDEDSAENSFAGQFATFLFQQGIDHVRESLKRCWASAYSERALHYRRERGLPLTNIQVAVVIQRMIDAESAGVVFSRNPVRLLDRKTLVVSSVWGLGEGLVSGELDADHFAVSRDDFSIVPTVVEKTLAFRAAATGGVEKVAVAAEKQRAPSLDGTQIVALAKLAIKIEEAFGAPQDIEWASSGGRLVLLQSRPITSLPPDAFFDPGVAGDGPILWDNSNIIESYAGVTSALTFSFVSRGYARVYEQTCELVGIPADIIAANRIAFRNMLGLIRGRIYYNLINWYHLLGLVPGIGGTSGFMETMMGVKQGLTPELAALFNRALRPPRYSVWRKLSFIAATVWRLVVLRRIIGRFVSDFAEVYDEARSKDLRAESLPALAMHVQDVEERLMARWQAPIINDMRCMLFFGTLKKLTEEWVAGTQDAGSLQNDSTVRAGGPRQHGAHQDAHAHRAGHRQGRRSLPHVVHRDAAGRGLA